MRRTLVVTNDFPPRPGGIQSYLHAFARSLPAEQLVVYAPSWRDDAHVRFDAKQAFEVVRHPGTLMLPTPDVAKRARQLALHHGCEVVWFGAAAPLALLAPTVRRAGAHRVLASTHGHEVGWSMLPVARNALRRIGEQTDVLTFVSRYTRRRFASAFGPRAALEHLPPGVDGTVFRPDPAARAELRARYGLGGRPVVVCVSRLVARKGQDMLIRALPRIRDYAPGAALVLVGGGPYRGALHKLAAACGVERDVVFTGGVAADELAAHHCIGDVFAMPCRTRGAGLDVEGLGIVFLEASASGLPVVAGRSGGAPETVLDGHTGRVVDGGDVTQLAGAVGELLADPDLAARMGAAGQDWVNTQWRWDRLSYRLQGLIDGP